MIYLAGVQIIVSYWLAFTDIIIIKLSTLCSVGILCDYHQKSSTKLPNSKRGDNLKRRYGIFVSSLLILMIFSGCQRRFMPNQPMPGQQGGMNQNISSAKDRSIYYNGVTTSDTKAQTGMNGNTPIYYTVSNGSRIRIMGKYDGYYVAVLPNNQLGLVPIDNARQDSTEPTKPIPTPTPPAGAGNTGVQPGFPRDGTAGSNLQSEASAMINLVNQSRSQAGLKPLNSNGEITKLAGLKASDMVKNNYFSHNSPTYGSPFDMMKTYGVSYLYAGENLAANRSVQAAEQTLMNSPQHKANILSSNFTDIGIGITQKADGSKVYVQMFIGK